jgi:hypothetical protein
MGYSPIWVSGGKTIQTWLDTDDDTEINRPVAEVLNPHFSNVLGLYSATDGDSNALIAYTLAALQWPDDPDISEIEAGSTGNGYNCDVCDFTTVWNSTDTTGYVGGGVRAAVNALESGMVGYNNQSIHITDTIGYGITPGSTGVWGFSTISENVNSPDAGTRGTTWAYIAKSIQRTMISTHGNGFQGGFGNFTPNDYAPHDGHSSRIVTLGHDSSSGEGSIKMDYQDPRIYQICKNMNDL